MTCAKGASGGSDEFESIAAPDGLLRNDSGASDERCCETPIPDTEDPLPYDFTYKDASVGGVAGHVKQHSFGVMYDDNSRLSSKGKDFVPSTTSSHSKSRSDSSSTPDVEVVRSRTVIPTVAPHWLPSAPHWPPSEALDEALAKETEDFERSTSGDLIVDAGPFSSRTGSNHVDTGAEVKCEIPYDDTSVVASNDSPKSTVSTGSNFSPSTSAGDDPVS
jgi:hypothetical protein